MLSYIYFEFCGIFLTIFKFYSKGLKAYFHVTLDTMMPYCLIYKSTPNFVCSVYFLCKRDLHISCFLLIFESEKRLSQFLFHSFDQIDVFKGTVVNRALPTLRMEGHLKLRFHSGSHSTFEFPIRVNLSGPSLYCTARTLG